jgi:hypothetical protein
MESFPEAQEVFYRSRGPFFYIFPISLVKSAPVSYDLVTSGELEAERIASSTKAVDVVLTLASTAGLLTYYHF